MIFVKSGLQIHVALKYYKRKKKGGISQWIE